MSRGSVSFSYNLRWEVPFSEDLFNEWTNKGELNVDEDGDSHLLLGPALPKNDGECVAQLDLFHRVGEGSIRIIFTSFEKPDVPPPEEVVKKDAQIGGKVGLSSILDRLKQTKDIVGRYNIGLTFEESNGWSCKVLPVEVFDDPILKDLATTILTEQIGYRFVDGISGLQELSFIYFHNPKKFSVRAFVKGPVTISETLQSHVVTDLTELIKARFFALNDLEDELS